ncbi:MAG TPA: hypothetical protein VK780_04525 [Thermoanaerobaculia bacterium]|nr:hypothetical protein [Thermoanaerobaculia bacterium]
MPRKRDFTSRRSFYRCLPALLSLACAFACSSPSRQPQAGVVSRPASSAASRDSFADGSSQEKAIVVPRDTEREGIAWEYAWIQKRFGAYRRKGQRLLMGDRGRRYDQVSVQLADGTDRTLYFDITRYFGRD